MQANDNSKGKLKRHVQLRAMAIFKLKGLKTCWIYFNPDYRLTAIMGVNGIGKSTIIHALACCFRPETVNGERRKFSSFFPPTTNSTWKNSRFILSYEIVDDKGVVIGTDSTMYSKAYDRWTPKYDRQPVKDIKYFGVDTCLPDIEANRTERYKFDIKDQTEKKYQKIVEKASYILNKKYIIITKNITSNKTFIGVKTEDGLSYSSLSMGAGEQRVFRILDAIYTAAPFSLILIDEIDLLLHPDALKRLVNIINDLANDKKLQVIFTTHSLIMDELRDIVDIKYLDISKEKMDVYDNITSLGWRAMSGDIKKPVRIYVEDDLALLIVKSIAKGLNMLSKVSVNKFGAASNAFTLASSMIIREENVDNTLIVLDGDVYTSDDSKRDMIKKVYSGNEEWANDKRNLSLTLIKQFNLPKDEQPEHFLHSLLCENQNSDNEVVEVAKRINGVKDKHEWINQIVKEIDVGSEVVINDIINECSKSNQWDDYVKPVYDWLFERRKI